ncbi:hypothetical protein GE09DRAFT_1095336 [Coniochaeta sp. 2T2.1]|nr:hypothetical protein GE09DRAFT_1095336 [Coniochaeta sp. 2T2.1]
MSHTPTLLIHRTFLESLIPTSKNQQALLDAAVSSLPPPTRDIFLSQMGHHGGHKVTDILATNSFQTDLGGTDGHHYGNYPPVSRFNHDCRPNVAFYIDQHLNHRTTTVRDVAQGEELTISYLDSFAPRAERQRRALGAWGFRCGCAQCSLSAREGEKSDRRLEEIARLRGVLEDVDSTGVDGRMVRRYVKLWRDERLDLAMAGAWTVVALNWNMLGEEEMARKYARLAVEAGEIEFGEGAGDVKEMRELERWPRRHVSWRRRVEKTGS